MGYIYAKNARLPHQSLANISVSRCRTASAIKLIVDTAKSLSSTSATVTSIEKHAQPQSNLHATNAQSSFQ
jgi:hypothetical protein